MALSLFTAARCASVVLEALVRLDFGEGCAGILLPDDDSDSSDLTAGALGGQAVLGMAPMDPWFLAA